MSGVLPIGSESNYRVNPIYLEYANKYKKACMNFQALDKKIKNAQEPKKADFDERHAAEIAKKKFMNLCQTTVKVLEGGNSTREQAMEQAGKLHKIDYYC